MATAQKKHFLHRTGPGGMKCPCCGEPPGRKRKELNRYLKHSENFLNKQKVQKEVADMEEDNH